MCRFIDNKYKDLYYRIIEKAKSENRVKSSERYYELHHIIPKSLGGTNEDSNLVLLSAREHFICHYLLLKFTKGSDYHKMLYVVTYISNNSKESKINSRLYESWKLMKYDHDKLSYDEKYGNIKSKSIRAKQSEAQKGEKSYWYGKKIPKYVKNKISSSRKGKTWEEIYGQEQAKQLKIRMSGRVPPNKGKTLVELVGKERAEELTEINRQQQRRTHLGRKRSPETCRRISESNKGRIISKVSRQKASNTVSSYWKNEDSIYNTEEYRKKLSKSQKERHAKSGPKLTKKQMEESINNTESISKAVLYACEHFNKVSRPTFDKYMKEYEL